MKICQKVINKWGNNKLPRKLKKRIKKEYKKWMKEENYKYTIRFLVDESINTIPDSTK